MRPEGMERRSGGQAAILAALVESLSTMRIDWEGDFSGEIGPDTCLVGDLGFSSMDLVMLVVDVQQRYDRYDLPWQELFAPGGRYVDDVRVGDAVEFLCRYLLEPGQVASTGPSEERPIGTRPA